VVDGEVTRDQPDAPDRSRCHSHLLVRIKPDGRLRRLSLPLLANYPALAGAFGGSELDAYWSKTLIGGHSGENELFPAKCFVVGLAAVGVLANMRKPKQTWENWAFLLVADLFRIAFEI